MIFPWKIEVGTVFLHIREYNQQLKLMSNVRLWSLSYMENFGITLIKANIEP